MIYGLYQSAAGMMTNEYRQDVLANNIANAETVAFKRQVAVFSERLRADQAGRRQGAGDASLRELTGGVWLGETRSDFDAGAFINTDNPTDAALAGPGFFLVSKNGREYLTRDGRFVVAPDGSLVAASDGAGVLGVGGGPIHVNPHGGQVSFDEDGKVQQGGLTVGRLAVVDVANPGGLRHAGAGRYAAAGAEQAPVEPHVISGHVEASGVEPIRELAAMLEATRAYQLNAQMLTLQDQTAARVINFAATV